MVERAIIRIIHNKIIEVSTQPRVKSSFSSTSIPYLSEKGNQIQHGPRGKNMEMGKKYHFFFPPLMFYKFFCHKKEKNWTRGENIILFLLKLISKKLSRKKGKVNTMQHGQGEKHRHRGKTLTQRERIFSPCESRTINCMA
jgi:hypothetical protein